MLATFAFDVCHDVYCAAREVLDTKISTINLESCGKYAWHPDRLPRLAEFVADFAMAGERVLGGRMNAVEREWEIERESGTEREEEQPLKRRIENGRHDVWSALNASGHGSPSEGTTQSSRNNGVYGRREKMAREERRLDDGTKKKESRGNGNGAEDALAASGSHDALPSVRTASLIYDRKFKGGRADGSTLPARDYAIGGRASRMAMFRVYYLGGAEYQAARRHLGISELTWADWSGEIRARVGGELARTGVFPPSKYFKETSAKAS